MNMLEEGPKIRDGVTIRVGDRSTIFSQAFPPLESSNGQAPGRNESICRSQLDNSFQLPH